MNITQSPAYQKAFVQYLRRGTSVEATLKQIAKNKLSFKKLGNSSHYIWYSQEDGKVRPAHAANHGKMFGWNSPPPTSHPGEDFNCRCWAMPIGDNQYAHQLLITSINDNSDRWNTSDFVRHYLGRSGRDVSLSEVGALGAVIEHYATQATARDGTIGVYEAVEKQIMQKAKESGAGSITYFFEGNYNFQHQVTFSLGDSVVSGLFIGDVRQVGEYLIVAGIVTYDFRDAFRDPTSRVERLMEAEGISRQEAENRVGASGDYLGVPYAVTDRWQTKFNGTVVIR